MVALHYLYTEERGALEGSMESAVDAPPHCSPTLTVIELREPLLREPLLREPTHKPVFEIIIEHLPHILSYKSIKQECVWYAYTICTQSYCFLLS